eukprot:scaffold4929_cov176-Amphora_coffeaeformis.AAC.19
MDNPEGASAIQYIMGSAYDSSDDEDEAQEGDKGEQEGDGKCRSYWSLKDKRKILLTIDAAK